MTQNNNQIFPFFEIPGKTLEIFDTLSPEVAEATISCIQVIQPTSLKQD